MHSSPRPLLALASTLIAMLPVAILAAPQVGEETLVADISTGEFIVSAHGVHVAAVIPKGSRQAVVVDGVEGPRFDQIHSPGGLYDFDGMGGMSVPSHQIEPNNAGRMISGIGAGGGTPRVLFNRDGTHYAYVARSGSEMVLIFDNKEVHRGSYIHINWLAFSPDGNRLVALTSDKDGLSRVIVDGQAGPVGVAISEFHFTPDGAHYAYTGRENNAQQKPWMVVDGRQVKHLGDIVGFAANGTLFTRTVANDNQILLANGKPLAQGSTLGFIEINGNRLVMVVTPPLGTPPRQQTSVLTIDGKIVPGTEDVHVMGTWFSPDGRRYAVLCQRSSPVMETFMIVDGKRELSYQSIWTTDPYKPSFSPDSSKFLYIATSTAGQQFVVVNGEESDGVQMIATPPVWSPVGSRLAWGGMSPTQKPVFYLDGKSIALPDNQPPGATFRFSPDGAHMTWYTGMPNAQSIVIDGAPLPGVAGLGFLGAPAVDGQNAMVRMSPNGKHAAYVARDAKDTARQGVWVDGQLITPIVAPQANRVTFSPDSQHVAWAILGTKDNIGVYRVYVDGRETLTYASTLVDHTPGTWEMGADGTLTLLGVDDGALKRYRIPAPTDSNIASMLAAAGGGVAAATPPPPPPAPAAVRASTLPPPATVAASATPLTWNDLVRRPEARPAACTVNKEYRFQGGAVVRSGTTVNIIEIKPAELVLETPDGRITFGAKPDETDTLAVANAAWAQLTPAQRELTYPTLFRRTDLWPYRVKLLVSFNLEGTRTRVGDSALLIGLEGNLLLISHETAKLLFTVEASQTDLMAQARALVASEAGAPGRVIEELAGKLVSPIDGRASTLDTTARPKLVVMYRGAGWCGPCLTFSPQLVKVLKAKAPQPSDVTVIFVSGDRSPAEAKAYATKIGIDWPTIYYTSRDQMPAFNTLFGDTIPQLVVTDRHGKVLIDSNQVGTAQALQQLQKLL